MELCHRCQGELPHQVIGEDRGPGGGASDAILFCPHCSAPQIMLPEHLRPETPNAATTGATPPPRAATPQGSVDWKSALVAASIVAAVCALLSLGSLAFDVFGLVRAFWILGGAVLAIGLYARRSPLAHIDGRTGKRIGVVTGLLMSAAMFVTLAGAGVVAKYVLHRATHADQQTQRDERDSREMVMGWLHRQNAGPDTEQKYIGWMNSPEMRAGSGLFAYAFNGGLILLLSAGGGAFAGMLRGSKRGLAQRS